MTLKTDLRNKLYDRDGRVCHYCGIEESDFLPVWGQFYGGKKRGGTLEVDRKDSSKGYEIDNCVLACAVCNNAKSDKFTYEEFKAVGDIIGNIWRERKNANETLHLSQGVHVNRNKPINSITDDQGIYETNSKLEFKKNRQVKV